MCVLWDLKIWEAKMHRKFFSFDFAMSCLIKCMRVGTFCISSIITLQSNFQIRDKIGTLVLSIVEKLSSFGSITYLTISSHLIFDCVNIWLIIRETKWIEWNKLIMYVCVLFVVLVVVVQLNFMYHFCVAWLYSTITYFCECLCFHVIGQFMVLFFLCDWTVLHFYFLFCDPIGSLWRVWPPGTVIDSHSLSIIFIHELLITI